MNTEQLEAWFAGRIPDAWFSGSPSIVADRDEILVTGTLPPVDLESGASDEARAAAASGRIRRFREDTRAQRMRIADEAERRFDRKVAWAAVCGDVTETFTSLSVPVMTRLRIGERAVLDTLIDSGVARSRSEALGWCVRLVARNQGEWLKDLREAMEGVKKVRESGPA